MRYAFALFCCVIFSASCAEDARRPQLELDTSRIEFGAVAVGERTTRAVGVRNSGELPLSLLAPAAGPFSTQLDATSLAPGDRARLQVSFQPTAAGPVAETLQLYSDDPGALVPHLVLAGLGVTEDSLLVAPQAVEFGNVVQGTTARREVQLLDLAGGPLALTFAEGANVRDCQTEGQGEFCVRWASLGPDAGGSVTLSEDEEVSLVVELTPSTTAPTRGDFTLHFCDAPECTVRVDLTGAGIEHQLQCTPTPLDFGAISPGRCRTRNLSCANTGALGVVVTRWSTTGDAFAAASSQVTALAAEEALEIDVQYCPEAAGAHEGTLHIETSQAEPYRNLDVTLVGRGGGGDLQILPEAVDFGLAAVIAPVDRNLLVTNRGFSEVAILDATTYPADSFSVVGGVPTSVPPGGAAVITLRFQPTAEGIAEATLRLSTNDADAPEMQVALRGEGIDSPRCDLEISPHPLRFGVRPAMGPFERTLVLRNTGEDPCLVNRAVLAPGTDPAFSLPGDALADALIPPGEARALTVRFAPSTNGTHVGTVEVTYANDLAPVAQVELRGEVSETSLITTPPAVDFGEIAVGCASAPRSPQLANLTNQTATVERVQITSPSTSPFSLASAPTLPFDLAPTDTLTLAVTFGPDRLGRAFGSVEIDATVGGTTHLYVLPLAGVGAIGPIQHERFLAPGWVSGGPRFTLRAPPVVSTIEVRVETQVVPSTLNGVLQWEYEPATRSVRFTPAAAPRRDTEVEVLYAPECL